MGRPRTAVGTSGKISVTGYRTVDGEAVRVSTGEKATHWVARTRFRDEDGVSRPVERRAATKAAAENKLKTALRARETPVQSQGAMHRDLNLVDAGEVWIAQNAYAHLTDKTRTQYAAEFDRYLRHSELRGLSLTEVNRVATMERFLQRVADENGNAAAKAARRVLSNLLNTAVRHHALPYSACRDVRQPRARHDSASAGKRAQSRHDTDRSFTKAERQAVREVADRYPREESTDIADLVGFLAGTGVRLSEALEHTWWDDVDLDAPEPQVRVRGTKTDKADRVLPLPSTLVTRLRRRAEQRGRDGLVFASPRLHDKTKPRDRRNVLRHLRARLDAAGVPWATSHTFRRTVATFMDEAAYPLAEIANQLGHANVNVTATYLGRRQGSNRAAQVLD